MRPALGLLVLIWLVTSAFTHGQYIPTVNAYFSSSTGNDANPCTMASPCQTLVKATALTYGPSSTINLLAGDTFVTTTPAGLNLTGAGDISVTQNSYGPITVQSYGGGTCNVIAQTTTGCATIQIGGAQLGAIFLDDTNYATIQNIRIIGGNPTQLTYGVGYCIQHDNHAGSNYGLTITNVECEDVSQGLWSRVAAGTFTNVSMTDNYVHGIVSTQTADVGILIQGPRKITVQGNLVTNQGGHVPQGSGGASGNGILISDGASVVLDQFNVSQNNGQNIVSCGGPYGNWFFEVIDGTIQFNEVVGQGSRTSAVGCDNGGYDLDGGTAFSVIQYNYAHDDFGPLLNIFLANSGGFPWHQNVIRYNIGEETVGTRSQVGIMLEIAGGDNNNATVAIYNNTFESNSNNANLANWNHSACIYAINSAQIIIANNICYNSGSSGNAAMLYSGNPLVGYIFRNNDYYRVTNNNTTPFEWQWVVPVCISFCQYTTLALYNGRAGQDIGSSVANPTFTTPLDDPTCYVSGTPAGPQPCPAGAVLQAGSAMIGAGLNLTTAYQQPMGSVDYYGNTTPNGVGTGYNIGADGGNP